MRGGEKGATSDLSIRCTTLSCAVKVINIILANVMENERKFIYNLRCLKGRADAVSIDTMLETLLYIGNNSVDSGHFLTEEYLSVVYGNDELISSGVYVCSLERLVTRYREACQSNDAEFLNRIRVVHREARAY